MRDLLTALAGAVILILVAALALPPFVDWQGQRALVDETLARSLGLPARSEGRIDIRLLPSPRLSLGRLRLGGDQAGLDARAVTAEVALAPLLKGELRFTETRIGRAEIRLPVDGDETLPVPAGLLDTLRSRELAIEDLHVGQFLVTTTVAATGRTDQFHAQDLSVQAPALAGPWRIEGTSGGLPFRLASGELGPDNGLPLKLSGGGDTHPRFEADARLTLAAAEAARPDSKPPEAGLTVQAEGSARLVVGPPTQAAGAYLPFALNGRFKARGAQLRFETVGLEIDPGGQALRLSGSGRLDLRQGRAGLSLEARRLDLDAFLLSSAGQALLARGLPREGAGLPVMLDIEAAVESAVLGLGEWSNLALAATLDRSGGLVLRNLDTLAPGAARITASGALDTGPSLRFSGPVSLSAPASDGFGRYLRRLGLEGPAVAVLDGRAVEAAAEVSAAAPSLSLRNLRLGLGPARITGNARYTAAEGGQRGRFEAQLAARGLDVATLPALGGTLAGLHDHDLSLTLQARDVRYGSADAGTIAARIESDGPSLVVDSLEVAGLAGANARLSGRISPDGAGRIAGRLSAPVAAPLIALLDRLWLGEAARVPAFLRTAPLDLAVSLERDAGAGEALRAEAKGTAGGGDLDLAVTGRPGRIDRARIALASPRSGTWFERTDIPGLQAPGHLTLTAERAGGEGLSVQGEARIAGLTLTIVRPLRIAGPLGQTLPGAGEIRAESADLGPFLALTGAAVPTGAWPAALRIAFAETNGAPRLDLAGRLAGADLDASLAPQAHGGGLAGTARIARLSLPQLAAALVAPSAPAPPARGGSPRFAPAPGVVLRFALDLGVATLDLGRGLTATEARVTLGYDDGTLSLRDLTGRLAEGRLTGSATVGRRGAAVTVAGEGSLADASLAALADGSPLSGRLGADLRFGTSGESPAALAAGLAGSGRLTLTNLAIPEADPDALGRALTRALETEDPLREGRLAQIVGEELARGGAEARGSVEAPATIIGGVLRAGPLDLDLGPARWTGSLAYDLREGRLDARGTLRGGAVPPGWNAGPPTLPLTLAGPLAAPERSLDTGALSTGLAAVVLQRELERIELFEADQSERQRRRARIEMDKARAAALKAAADKAAADRLAAEKAAAEEAARQARLKAQQAAEDAARRGSEAQPGPAAPLDIRPPGAQP